MTDAPTVTLDGRPAVVTNRKGDFAVIRRLDDGYAAEFAWPTVDRIIARGGAFKS